MAGTPDDIRKERFRAKWDASGLAAKIDFEASDPDLVQEDDIVSEGSLNDTRDSVVSTICTLCSRNFQNVKLRLDFVEN